MKQMTIDDLIWFLQMKLSETAQYALDKEETIGFEKDIPKQVVELYKCVQQLELIAFEMRMYIDTFTDVSEKRNTIEQKRKDNLTHNASIFPDSEPDDLPF